MLLENISKNENVIEINDHKTDDVSRVLLRYHVLEVGGAGKTIFSIPPHIVLMRSFTSNPNDFFDDPKNLIGKKYFAAYKISWIC